jgi:ABC-type oligopeptide transport system substrate-binding subunit
VLIRSRFSLVLVLIVVAALALAGSASAAPKEVAYVCKGEDICLLDPDNPSNVNQTRILKLKLTKLAIAILKQTGKLKMSVTVTTTIAGQAPVKESHNFELFVKPKPKEKHR